MTSAQASRLADVALIPLHSIPAPDALLTVAQCSEHLPFTVQRAFFIRAGQDGVKRGHHAHRALHQTFICVAGAVDAVVDDGDARKTFTLDSVAAALNVPPGIWSEQTYRRGSVLLVLCDAPYDARDYIRDYQEFLRFKKGAA